LLIGVPTIFTNIPGSFQGDIFRCRFRDKNNLILTKKKEEKRKNRKNDSKDEGKDYFKWYKNALFNRRRGDQASTFGKQ
jgi:hypothetical protein